MFSTAALLALCAIAGLQLVPGHAQAQAQAPAPTSATAPPARPDPADPKAPVPAAPYRSALNAYQAFSEPQVAPWRDTNELVRQRGGWRAYAREAREPDAARQPSPAASQPAAAPMPAASGHSGHATK